MDPFEEFEFKPLTDGLGFHKKAKELKKGVSETTLLDEVKSATDLPTHAPMEESLGDGIGDTYEPRTQAEAYKELLAVLDKPVTGVKSVERAVQDANDAMAALEVGIPEEVSEPVMPSIDNDMPGIIEREEQFPVDQKIQQDTLQDSTVSRGASNSPKPENLEEVPVSFMATIVDGIFVSALSMFFLAALILVTKVDLGSVILSAQTDFTVQMSLAVLFIAVMQMYIVVARTFFGRSFGEWTFDCQLGRAEQQQSTIYPIRVLWRSFFNVATGLIVFPLLSFLLRRDLLAKVSGLQLYRHRD